MLQPGMLQAECQLSALHCKAYNDWAQAHFAEDCSNSLLQAVVCLLQAAPCRDQAKAAGCVMDLNSNAVPR